MTDLTELSKQIRKEVLAMSLETGEGHVAPAYSCVDIIVTLYENILRPEDKFILSKGHACFAQYCMLRYKGLNPTIRGHPDLEPEQGITCTTGSLGHGLPIGIGMALAKKLKKEPGRVFVLLGDGECQEGVIWESMNIAYKHQLDNLVIIVDNNGLQALTTTKEVIGDMSLINKFFSFGALVTSCDGHNHEELTNWLSITPSNKPYVIIANTIKGKGLSCMENKPEWHNKIPSKEQIEEGFV
jgi:transketolase